MVLMTARYCGFVRGLMYFFEGGDTKMMSRVKNFSTIVFSVEFCVKWYQIHIT